MVVSEEIKTLLNKAKIGLMSKRDSAFFTTILFSLKFMWDREIPTAYTDGEVIHVNPEFFESLSPEFRITMMVHEAMHVAYMHVDPTRMQMRDPEVWTQAADHVINIQLKSRGFAMPDNWLCEDRFDKLSTEEVYDILIEEQKKGKGNPPPGMMDVKASCKSQPDLVQGVKDMLVRAQMQSQMANEKPGAIPGDLQLFLDKLLNPKLPWQTILRKYLTSMSKHDYSWRKPNRRHFPEHHLPSQWSESMEDLVIGVDISGSVADHEFKRFVDEIAGIFKMMKPKKITLVQFDTRIQHVDEIRSIADLMKVEFHGRGGTDVTEILDFAAKKKAKITLIFTDGDFYKPKTDSKPNTIWMIHNNEKHWVSPGFGKTIHYTIENEDR